MLNRFLSIFITLTAFILIINFNSVSAKNENRPEITFVPPEQEGTYDVPGHPNMKVRVFIHHKKEKPAGNPGKPGQPSPTPIPQLNCNLSDPGSNALDGLTGWHLPNTWQYSLNPASAPATIGSANFATISQNSVTAWTQAINNNVNVERGADTTVNRARFDGTNIVTWGRTSGSALGVAYTWYYTDTHEVAEVDTILNKSYPWSWSGEPVCAYPGSYDAQNILTHEVGHWFGADDMYASEYEHNTMFGYGSPEEAKKDTLTNGDKTAISSIYNF